MSFNTAAMPTIIGVLQVIFGVLVGPFLLAFMGGWFGGEADPDEIRQSVAWSHAPFAFATICWVLVLVAYGGVPVQDAAPPESGSELVRSHRNIVTPHVIERQATTRIASAARR